MITCLRCGLIVADELFIKSVNMCKLCNKERCTQYRENNKVRLSKVSRIYQKKYRENNRERLRKWRAENPNAIKKWRKNNSEKVKLSKRNWEKNNKEKVNETHKNWLRANPEKAREISIKKSCQRRQLGHEPINNWFKGSEAHHLRYSNSHDEQDNNITIYVPRKLHRSIAHNGNTGKNIREINIRLLKWYLSRTPIENQNKKAVDLYLKYCQLLEPVRIK